MWEKVRARLTYANVVATLALFLVVAGGGAYAAFKLKPNSVKSKHIAPDAIQGVDAAESTFGQMPSAKVADSAGTANTASTAETANGVVANSIGPAAVQDPTRSVNLPLTALVVKNGTQYLDSTPSDGTEPDFVTSPITSIEWDDDSDGGGTNVADTTPVFTNFLVPPDYASGGVFAARISKDGHAGLTERFRCFLQHATGGGVSGFGVSLTAAATTLYTLNPGANFTPGNAEYIECWGDESSGGFGVSNAADNVIRLEGLEFRYVASQ